MRSRAAFYEAMVLFSEKYRPTRGAFFPKWLVLIGILVQAGFNIAGTLASSFIASLIDFVLINVILFAGISIRFAVVGMNNPYIAGDTLIMLSMHGLMSLSFLFTYSVQGIYSTERYSPSNALFSGLLASMIFVAGIYFTRAMAFSRIAFALSALSISFALVAWRELVPRIPNGLKRLIFATGRVIIVGTGPVASQLIRNAERDGSATICGIVWPQSENLPEEFEGYPVLGSLTNVASIIASQKASLVYIATTESWYSHFIEALSTRKRRHLTVKWVRRELIHEDPSLLPEIIPLENFTL